MRVVSEPEFRTALRTKLETTLASGFASCVTGPGRSGAVAAAYASHMLGVPFVPFGQPGPGFMLVVDTARQSGATLRKAVRRYERMQVPAQALAVFEEPPRVRFWYEAGDHDDAVLDRCEAAIVAEAGRGASPA